MTTATTEHLVDTQTRLLAERVDGGDVSEDAAQAILTGLVRSSLADGWSGAEDSLRRSLVHPWAVRAFRACDVTLELRTQGDIERAVREVLDAVVSPDFYDFAEDSGRDRLARYVAQALGPFLLPPF